MRPRQTLEALLAGLQGGMSTAQAMPFFSDVIDQRADTQAARQQMMLDQQEELQSARMDATQGLESLIADQAIGGVGIGDLKREIAVRYGSELQAMPELGGTLDQLLDAAYSEPAPARAAPQAAMVGGWGVKPQATRPRMKRSRISPLAEATAPESSWGELDDETRAEVAAAVSSAKQKGVSAQKVLADALKAAARNGATPEELQMIRDEVAFVWDQI
jgi:hypothetical protein